uniref:60S acidic ribosomal protein P1 n=1 Tax=Panagrolaimus sp. ES5 TaxID=591445 RepID=A0AC34FJN5_9BILA
MIIFLYLFVLFFNPPATCTVKMASNHELAVTYAALILEDEGIAITGEKIQAILTAAGVQVEPFWPSLYAKALEGVNVKDLISNLSSGVGTGGGAAPAAAAAAPSGGAAAAAPAKEEKKKEEPKEESEDEDMGFGLFD